MDSNHRSYKQQIYSLPPLATRELPHLMELVIGVEPTTCWLQVSCSAIEPHQHIWWKQQGSNLWPSACKADALPAELNFHLYESISSISPHDAEAFVFFAWAFLKRRALLYTTETVLSTPFLKFFKKIFFAKIHAFLSCIFTFDY